MRQFPKVAILLTSYLTLSSCGPEIKTVPYPLKAEHPERFVCERVDPEKDRPKLPKSYEIVWSEVTTVEQAEAEHKAFVAGMILRNNTVGAYIVRLEGANFTCWNNMQWQRDWYDNQKKD